MTDWSALIAKRAAELHASQRMLCKLTDMHRSTLRNCLKSEKQFGIDDAERILAILGLKLLVVPTGDEFQPSPARRNYPFHPSVIRKKGNSQCRQERRASVSAVKSSGPANAAIAPSSETASARLAMTSNVLRLVNAVTHQSGNKPAKPSLPFTGHA